ncbi:ABC-transporter ATP-binding component [Sporolactobacillus inulinus]|jgi:ABC-2 type transport system ATP-binding protein|uniref:ABC-transporter ATP-binding component n=1 Tax=Sporolactobacillus inulinus TaxID=2078 RepID=A0A4Y1ZI92_9BACL|nr:ATP-binding cassette domain-containing protein [Sporolactobacillus inulinus]GAY78078.1 ABC-transporter ATP-binding component [Sporolactobacillus inulinus]
MENVMNQKDQPLAIEAVDLVKRFGKHRAVDGINLAIPQGTVYGFLGPNGAGKTTTMKMLATLLKPDGGTAKIFGHDLFKEQDAVRACVSLTGQFASVDEDLSGTENLMLIARLMGYTRSDSKDRAAELLDAFDLQDAAKRQVKKYSGGMRRRLDIAASMVVRPKLLFLDEPTTGLDPRSRNQIWDIVRALVSTGTTVLLTTQYLDEADQLADRIAVIDHGKIIAEGTSSELKASVGTGILHVRLIDAAARAEAQQLLSTTLGTPVHLSSDPSALSAQLSDTDHAAKALTMLSDHQIRVSEFSLGQPSLDEVFLTLTGKPAEDSPQKEGASE